MSLPSPRDPLGYCRSEILDIIRIRGIHHRTFWKAFGVNTVAVALDGTARFYRCDVERALYLLNKKDGMPHLWD